jgi:hypothetical protein
MEDREVSYPSYTAEILRSFYPGLSGDNGDWALALGSEGLQLIWRTQSTPKPTPADIEALRNSAEWLKHKNRNQWAQQHTIRERKRLQAIMDAPDDAYLMSERVNALKQLQQLGE